MKKNIQKLTLGLLFTLLTFLQNACDECGTELCDLISEISIDGTNLAIFAGTPFNVKVLITNVAGFAQCEGGGNMLTGACSATHTNVKVEREVSANTYDIYFSNNYDTPTIPPKNVAEDIFSVIINDSGTYRFSAYADSEFEIEESNEDNNFHTICRSTSSLIVKVCQS
jgi:hypothetical protein